MFVEAGGWMEKRDYYWSKLGYSISRDNKCHSLCCLTNGLATKSILLHLCPYQTKHRQIYILHYFWTVLAKTTKKNTSKNVIPKKNNSPHLKPWLFQGKSPSPQIETVYTAFIIYSREAESARPKKSADIPSESSVGFARQFRAPIERSSVCLHSYNKTGRPMQTFPVQSP